MDATDLPIDLHPEVFRRDADALGRMIHEALSDAARAMYDGLVDMRAAEAATRETDQARQFAEAAEAALRHGTAVADKALQRVDLQIATLEKFGAAATAPSPGRALAREIRAHARTLTPEARAEAVFAAICAGEVHVVSALLDAPTPLRLLTDAQRERLCRERDARMSPEVLRRERAQIEVTRAARAKLANARALFEREVRALMPKQVVAQGAVDAALAGLREGASA